MKTLSALARDFAENKRCAESTRSMARRFLRRFMDFLEKNHGGTPINYLGVEDIVAWLQALSSRRIEQTGLPMKQHYREQEVGAVRQFCRHLVRQGRVNPHVLDLFPRYKNLPCLPRPTPVHARVRSILNSLSVTSLSGYMFRTIAEVLYTSAMRPCELLALNAADIDLEHGLTKILGKGKKERIVPLGRTACRFLDTYLNGVRGKLLRTPNEPALWLNSKGFRLSYRTLIHNLHPALSTHEGKAVTAYTLRRACATEMIRGGASVWSVKELLGHEDLRTLQCYVQLTVVDLQKTHARCHPRDRARSFEDEADLGPPGLLPP